MSKALSPEKELVTVIKDGKYVVEAGKPAIVALSIRKHIEAGYTVHTMTIAAFRKANLKWIYDKPKPSKP